MSILVFLPDLFQSKIQPHTTLLSCLIVIVVKLAKQNCWIFNQVWSFTLPRPSCSSSMARSFTMFSCFTFSSTYNNEGKDDYSWHHQIHFVFIRYASSRLNWPRTPSSGPPVAACATAGWKSSPDKMQISPLHSNKDPIKLFKIHHTVSKAQSSFLRHKNRFNIGHTNFPVQRIGMKIWSNQICGSGSPQHFLCFA